MNRRAAGARGGGAARARARGPAGDDSSDSSDDESKAMALKPQEQWEKQNWHSPANTDRPRTADERRAVAEKKHLETINFLRSIGYQETEFGRNFTIPTEKRDQGPRIDPYNNDAVLVCEELAHKRREYFKKKEEKESTQKKGDLNGLLHQIKRLEEAFDELRARVKKVDGGKPVDLPDGLKVPVEFVVKKKK